QTPDSPTGRRACPANRSISCPRTYFRSSRIIGQRDLKFMLRTRFCDLLGIEAPIIQAPIWPAASPELAAAVCKAGGLGSIAAVFGSAERVKQHIARVRELTDRPFAVNHVVPFLDEEAFAVTLAAR